MVIWAGMVVLVIKTALMVVLICKVNPIEGLDQEPVARLPRLAFRFLADTQSSGQSDENHNYEAGLVATELSPSKDFTAIWEIQAQCKTPTLSSLCEINIPSSPKSVSDQYQPWKVQTAIILLLISSCSLQTLYCLTAVAPGATVKDLCFSATFS
ncbi:hypothetical protein RRG08_052081 [Elysia crispata]|uniref:Uncharacterized protein n=1 Tax=Elysia crispata TaxID=231223 RepID=A0AAE1A4H3_9GAST|nr:hypothetical protein RRG08_052081 [Elysia crispata]